MCYYHWAFFFLFGYLVIGVDRLTTVVLLGWAAKGHTPSEECIPPVCSIMIPLGLEFFALLLDFTDQVEFTTPGTLALY